MKLVRVTMQLAETLCTLDLKRRQIWQLLVAEDKFLLSITANRPSRVRKFHVGQINRKMLHYT